MGEEAPTTTAWAKESVTSSAFSEGGPTSADWTEALSFVYSPDNLPVLTSDGEYVYVRG